MNEVERLLWERWPERMATLEAQVRARYRHALVAAWEPGRRQLFDVLQVVGRRYFVDGVELTGGECCAWFPVDEDTKKASPQAG